MSTNTEIRDEQIRMVKVRVLADLTAYRLHQGKMNRVEGLALIGQAREEIVALCPGKEAAFDLVLRPRFLRILDERALTLLPFLASLAFLADRSEQSEC